MRYYGAPPSLSSVEARSWNIRGVIVSPDAGQTWSRRTSGTDREERYDARDEASELDGADEAEEDDGEETLDEILELDQTELDELGLTSTIRTNPSRSSDSRRAPADTGAVVHHRRAVLRDRFTDGLAWRTSISAPSTRRRSRPVVDPQTRAGRRDEVVLADARRAFENVEHAHGVGPAARGNSNVDAGGEGSIQCAARSSRRRDPQRSLLVQDVMRDAGVRETQRGRSLSFLAHDNGVWRVSSYAGHRPNSAVTSEYKAEHIARPRPGRRSAFRDALYVGNNASRRYSVAGFSRADGEARPESRCPRVPSSAQLTVDFWMRVRHRGVKLDRAAYRLRETR